MSRHRTKVSPEVAASGTRPCGAWGHFLNQDIVERIYEAAFVPDMWPQVLAAASAMSRSASGSILVFSDRAPARGRIGYPSSIAPDSVGDIERMFTGFLAADSWKLSPGILRMYDMRPASFVHVEGFMTPDEIERDQPRVDLKAIGIGAHLCAAIPVPSGELITIVFQRWLRDGPHDRRAVDGLDRLMPHFGRAGLMAARLGLARANATVSALHLIGLPAAVLDRRGRVVASNALLETVGRQIMPAAFGVMALSNAAANALFQQSLAQAGRPAARRIGSIPIAAAEGHPAMVIHVLPLQGAAHDLFAGGDVVVAVTTVSASSLVPDASVLMGLFDLTPAEVKLASALTRGLSLKASAETAGVAVSTARAYLERIFAKTGVHQQSQLVALLKGAASFR